jgi:hypothetical protein
MSEPAATWHWDGSLGRIMADELTILTPEHANALEARADLGWRLAEALGRGIRHGPHQTKAEWIEACGHTPPDYYWREPIEWCSICKLLLEARELYGPELGG